MIKRVAACDQCGTEQVLEHDTDRAPNDWWQVTHVKTTKLLGSFGSTVIFCERDCVFDWLRQQLSRET